MRCSLWWSEKSETVSSCSQNKTPQRVPVGFPNLEHYPCSVLSPSVPSGHLLGLTVSPALLRSLLSYTAVLIFLSASPGGVCRSFCTFSAFWNPSHLQLLGQQTSRRSFPILYIMTSFIIICTFNLALSLPSITGICGPASLLKSTHPKSRTVPLFSFLSLTSPQMLDKLKREN